MLKNKLRLFISVFTIFAMLLTAYPANAEGKALKEGDYVKYGTYHGAAILWRVVGFDADGDPMLWSDKLITSKPYVLYNNDIGFNEKCWETSYIRTWLNSAAGEGQTKYTDEDNAIGNPINAGVWDVKALTSEAGFLSPENFTGEEAGILKESKQKDTLVGKYVAGKEGGTKEFTVRNTDAFDPLAAIAKNAYYKYVSDRMFVIDVEQVNELYKKFGDYVNTDFTDEALQYETNSYEDRIDHYYDNSGIREIAIDQSVDFSPYYLRNMIVGADFSPTIYACLGVGYTNVGGMVSHTGYGSPDNPEQAGVRPACYIDMDKTGIESGSGTSADPYRFTVKNIYGNKDTDKPTPIRVVTFGSSYVKYNDASGMPFVDSANRTQVPLRLTMKRCGASVDWDSVNKIATVTKNGITVQVPIGLNYILKDGVKVETDTAAQIVNNRTYLPIRPVVEALGGEVGWDEAAKVVIINQDPKN